MHNPTNTASILTLMTEAAKSSGQIIRDNFRQDTRHENKSSHLDIVTKTDHLSQNNIHELLTAGMTKLGFAPSDIGFVEEESIADDIKKHNFIVDPIDGTTNFASGIPFTCVSIAYAVDKQMIIGLVYEPFSDTLYWGETGKGSFVKNSLFGQKPLKLEQKPIKSWLVGAHLNGLDVVDSQFATYQQIYAQVRGLRNIGSLTLDLCLMADNVFDAIYNKGCFMWDLAAASVILREAGGELYDYHGQVLDFDWQDTRKKYQVIACHPQSLEEVASFVE